MPIDSHCHLDFLAKEEAAAPTGAQKSHGVGGSDDLHEGQRIRRLRLLRSQSRMYGVQLVFTLTKQMQSQP
ncbi:MAG: hypothetical protein R3E60_06590 [Alphaproteobacteria bacterium]